MSATIKPDLRSRIAGLSAVTAAGFAVHIDHLPQSASDHKSVLLKRTGFDPHSTLSEADDDSLITEIFTVETRGKDSQTAESISDAIIDNLQALQGVNLGSSRKVGAVRVTDVSDGYEFDDFGGDSGNGMVTATFSIMHTPQ